MIACGSESSNTTSAWISSGLFALLTLGGVFFFGARWFAATLVLAAILHLATLAACRVRLGWVVLSSQAVIVVSTLLSVLGYVYLSVGPAKDGWSTVAAFIRAWPHTQTVPGYGLRLALFLGAVAVLALLWRSILHRPLHAADILTLAYSAAALAVPCGYALERPLFHAGGDPEATHFFFAAGIYGVEFPLLLYLAGLVAALIAFSTGVGQTRQRVAARRPAL